MRCLELLKRRGYNMKLRICGHGDEKEIYEFANTEKLYISTQDIEFLGYQNSGELAQTFKNSFCMIHPSYMDNSPNSICEAQVSG